MDDDLNAMATPIKVNFQVVSAHFKADYLPRYATNGAAGMDLHACVQEPLKLKPGERTRIPTGIAIQLPTRYMVGLVYARSGLALRHGLGLPNGVGVIDSDYTGELQVLLTNFGQEVVSIHPGDRIAQLVIAPIYVASFVQADELQQTERGTSGFGSTGVGSRGSTPAPVRKADDTP